MSLAKRANLPADRANDLQRGLRQRKSLTQEEPALPDARDLVAPLASAGRRRCPKELPLQGREEEAGGRGGAAAGPGGATAAPGAAEVAVGEGVAGCGRACSL